MPELGWGGGGGYALGVDLVGKGLPARLLSLLHLLLEGADHQEEAEPKNPADHSEEYVRNSWALGDAKENIEDAALQAANTTLMMKVMRTVMFKVPQIPEQSDICN